MIEDLSVRDFALIESVSLDFSSGFNVLTGETGAGKSILIGSLSFLFGGKASPDLIRSGCEEALVSGTILLNPSMRRSLEWLQTKEIEPDNDRIILRRNIKLNGKSSMWIQDTPITRSELQEFTSFLVDIHGQHEHQSLLKVEEHRRFLDSFAGITEEVLAFTAVYSSLAQARKKRSELVSLSQNIQDKKDLFSFAIEEINSAKLVLDEDVELEAEEQKLLQYEKLYSLTEQIGVCLHGQENLLALLKKIRTLFDSAVSIDSTLSPLFSRLETTYYDIEDIADSFRDYKALLSFDPHRLEQIQERLSILFRLKKKYGGSIQKILSYELMAQEELLKLDSISTNFADIEQEILRLEKELLLRGNVLSEKRRKVKNDLQAKVESLLHDLGMRGSIFTVNIVTEDINDKVKNCYPWGFDSVEFMISANLGEPVKPLAKIASGGEMSRVMLALKTILSDGDDVDTLIFDEIDTGIGGEVALSVGLHLKKLSAKKQILCITHLATIAARALTHIKIEKINKENKTLTNARIISNEAREEEIARMLAGDEYSSASVAHARELLTSL